MRPEVTLPDYDGLEVVGRRRRGGRGRRRGAGLGDARAVRRAQGDRPAGAGRRLRLDRPQGHRRRRGGAGRLHDRPLVRGRHGLDDGRAGRGAGRRRPPGTPASSPPSWSRRVRRPHRRHHGDRPLRQGEGTARAGRRVRADRERVRHAGGVPGGRTRAHPAGEGPRAGWAGPRQGAELAAGQHRGAAAGVGGARRVRVAPARHRPPARERRRRPATPISPPRARPRRSSRPRSGATPRPR